MARRTRIFVTRVCRLCRGGGRLWYADSFDRDNGETCSWCNGEGKVKTSYLRRKPLRCNCLPELKQCCDICTGWAAYVKKHGHPPKDKNVYARR